MMRLHSFETRKVREKEERGKQVSREVFFISWMGIIDENFQMEKKECKDQERLKM